MADYYDKQTITRGGRQFEVEFHIDYDADYPWDRCDGHGIVSEWTDRDKRPGEKILVNDYNRRRYYDVAGTVKLATRDKWGAEGGRRDGETAKQYIRRAVQEDFEYLRAWCEDEWRYVGLVVRMLPHGPERDLWGVETWKDYHETAAEELADEILGSEQRSIAEAFGTPAPTDEQATDILIGPA